MSQIQPLENAQIAVAEVIHSLLTNQPIGHDDRRTKTRRFAGAVETMISPMREKRVNHDPVFLDAQCYDISERGCSLLFAPCITIFKHAKYMIRFKMANGEIADVMASAQRIHPVLLDHEWRLYYFERPDSMPDGFVEKGATLCQLAGFQFLERIS